MFLRFATFTLLGLCAAALASPVPQAVGFNPTNALPAIPGAPALDTAGWSLEGGTAISSASNPSSTADVQDGPLSMTAERPSTSIKFTPAAGPTVHAAPIATTGHVNASVVVASAPSHLASMSSIASSSLEPFTTLSNDPGAAATAPPEQAGAFAPTPTLQGTPSSTHATLDPSAASAMADILSGLAALQDSTGLQEGATSKEDPSKDTNEEGALAKPPAPQPASAPSS
ncbi:hypothetical protein JCM3774_003991 [Rhodotorula dairenensis]